MSLFFHIVSRNNEFFIRARTVVCDRRKVFPSSQQRQLRPMMMLSGLSFSPTLEHAQQQGDYLIRGKLFFFDSSAVFSSVWAHTDDIGTTTMNISTVNFPNMKFYSLPHHVIIGTRSQCPKKSGRESVDIIKVLLVGSLFFFTTTTFDARRRSSLPHQEGIWKTSCIRCFIAPPGLAGKCP